MGVGKSWKMLEDFEVLVENSLAVGVPPELPTPSSSMSRSIFDSGNLGPPPLPECSTVGCFYWKDLLSLVLIMSLGTAAILLPETFIDNQTVASYWDPDASESSPSLSPSLWLLPDIVLLRAATSHLLMSVPSVVALLWGCSHVVGYVTPAYTWCSGWSSRTWSFIASLTCIVLIVQFRKATIALVPIKRYLIDGYLWNLLALVTFVVWSIVCDSIQLTLEALAKTRLNVLKHCKPIAKWKSIMENFCSFRRRDQDGVYTFEHTSTPMEVLAQIVQVYVFLFKMTAFFLFFLFFIGAAIGENIVWVMLGGILSGALVTFQMKDAIQNVLYISISNPFYLGEIVALMPTRGPMPDDPSMCLTGFVEAITLTHVVIRDFGRRQVWVPHDNFEDYNIANWTRRPSKLARAVLTLSPEGMCAAKAAELTAFMRRWIDTHEKIDQTYYKKAAIIGARDGLLIEAIFYPQPGERMIPMRQAFILASTEAANRLGLTIVPGTMRNPFPPGQTSPGSAEDDEHITLEDLLSTSARPDEPNAQLEPTDLSSSAGDSSSVPSLPTTVGETSTAAARA